MEPSFDACAHCHAFMSYNLWICLNPYAVSSAGNVLHLAPLPRLILAAGGLSMQVFPVSTTFITQRE
eukprot:358559-Amphidinium_carterae.1